MTHNVLFQSNKMLWAQKTCKNRCAFHKKQSFPCYKFLIKTHNIFFYLKGFLKIFPSSEKAMRNQLSRISANNAKVLSPSQKDERGVEKWTFSRAFWKLIPASSLLSSLFLPPLPKSSLDCQNNSCPFYLITFQSGSFSWILFPITSCSESTYPAECDHLLLPFFLSGHTAVHQEK